MTRLRTPTVAAVATACLVASACTADHHILSPKGSQASGIARIGWFMIITATVVSAGFLGLFVYGLVRGGRQRRWKPDDGFVVAGGIALPVVVIVVLTGLSLNQLNDAPGGDAVRLEITGHQYWWEVRYPDDGFTTANEFQIPVGRPVEVTLRSADVQHSFWVPDLAGKIDLYPGHSNHLVLDAQQPGSFHGQCAEYCGLQHAHMMLTVTAVPADQYRAWVRAQAAPAAEPQTPSQQAGRDAFVRGTCAECHTLRGTPARGTKGPDLTHLAARHDLAAGTIPRTRGGLGGWIANSQTIKPGNLMPPIPVAPEELQALLDYLESLT